MRISDWSSDVCSSDLELGREIAAVEQAGQKPSSIQLQLLASSAIKQNDMSAYVTALEKVVTYEPKPEYWLDLTLRTIGKPGYSNRFDLDTYRLRKATGTLDKGSDYADATPRARSTERRVGKECGRTGITRWG